MNREFIVMKLVCAKCGNLLELSTERPKNGAPYADGQPTGAAMLDQCIAVLPCQTCMEPVEAVRRAMAVLNSIGASA